jgi:hypothetical protein
MSVIQANTQHELYSRQLNAVFDRVCRVLFCVPLSGRDRRFAAREIKAARSPLLPVHEEQAAGAADEKYIRACGRDVCKARCAGAAADTSATIAAALQAPPRNAPAPATRPTAPMGFMLSTMAVGIRIVAPRSLVVS